MLCGVLGQEVYVDMCVSEVFVSYKRVYVRSNGKKGVFVKRQKCSLFNRS